MVCARARVCCSDPALLSPTRILAYMVSRPRTTRLTLTLDLSLALTLALGRFCRF